MDYASAAKLAALKTFHSRNQAFRPIVTPDGWSIRQILPTLVAREVGLSQSPGKSGHLVSISRGVR